MFRSLAIAICLPVTALAAPEAVFTGPDGLSVALTVETLASLGPQKVESTYTSSKGEVSESYTGVLLWDLVAANTGIDKDVKPALGKTILVTAEDGHQVAFSVGELAPDFGNQPIMIGHIAGGTALQNGWRIIAPNDARGARHVKDVVSLELR